MTIFSEIYGIYFRIAAKALKNSPLSEKELREIIEKDGFRDSVLFLPQKLIPRPDGSDWGFFKNDGGKLVSVLKNKPFDPLTAIQKRWLRSMLLDPRVNLFLDEDEAERLDKMLGGVEPLFGTRNFRCIDRYRDGDDYTDENYIRRFRMILRAIKERQVLEIDFTSGHGRRIHRDFLPFKIEYSPKNDKFRVYCYSVIKGRLRTGGIINIGRITAVSETDSAWGRPVSEKDYFESRKCIEPIKIRVTRERNAVERFLMEFASYEKRVERNAESEDIFVSLWYDQQDETELLIRLLSFGPVIEILSPNNIRKQAAERVNRQAELLKKYMQ